MDLLDLPVGDGVSRTLSTAAKAAIHGRTPADGEILLLTIAHADITTLRYAAAADDVVASGVTYTARAFRCPMPTDDDGIGETTLELDITSLADATVSGLVSLSATAARPTVTLSLVLESDPDTVEATFYFEMKNAEADLGRLRAALTYEPLLARSYPGYFYNAADHPDLFEGGA